MTLHLLAYALASAFLAGPWEREGLRARGAEALGAGPPWLGRVVAATLRAFRRPPRQRLSELTAFLEGQPALREATGPAAAVRPRLAHLLPAQVGMAEGREAWNLPALDREADLAALLGLSPEELAWFAARLDGRPWHGDADHYRHAVVPRPGGARLLEAPLPRLKALQRRLLAGLLSRVPAHPAACGFVRGRSVLDHARAHAGRPALLTLDLEGFFPSVSGARVVGVFLGLGYPEAVSRLLAGLCTHRTPEAVLAALPAATPAEAERRFHLRAALRQPHLPQGAPTSPALANLCAFGLDVRLAALARAAGARYTRYADDLALSGGPALARAAPRLTRRVAAIAREEGFRLHPGKTRLARRGARQAVCGVVVNAHPAVERRAYEALEATLYNCVRHGPAGQNRAGVPDLRAHLAGRVAWVEQLQPGRGRRLRALLEQIVW